MTSRIDFFYFKKDETIRITNIFLKKIETLCHVDQG